MSPPNQELEFSPGVVFHPSEYIADEATARGWTLHMLAAKMGGDLATQVAAMQLYACCQPGVLLGDDGARDTARAFNTSKDIWQNLDAMWQKYPERHSPLEPQHIAFYGLDDPAEGVSASLSEP